MNPAIFSNVAARAPQPAAISPVVVQSTPVASITGTKNARTITFPSGITAGNWIVLSSAASMYNPKTSLATALTSVTMTGTSGWAQIDSITTNDNDIHYGMIVWIGKVNTGGATDATITVDQSGNGRDTTITATEIGNLAATNAHNQTVATRNTTLSSNTITIGPTATLAVPNSIIIVTYAPAGTSGSDIGFVTPSGFTELRDKGDDIDTPAIWTGYRVVNSTAPISVTLTMTNNPQWGTSGLLTVLKGA